MNAINYSLAQLLKALIDQKGSDLHIAVGSPPRLRIGGSLLRLELPPLTTAHAQQLVYSILTPEQKRVYESNHELDFSFNIDGLARFRASLYQQKGQISAAFRTIPFSIRSLDDLRMPKIIAQLCQLPRGLVLVTGPTGSGKSTTLAAMLDFINQHSSGHIVTIEDPIEYVHAHKNCIVTQREIGQDTVGFAQALRGVLRQDPDVVMVGELRDHETISMALTTAETGHLVLGTLHTNSAISTLSRIIDVFPAHQQSQVRTQLSFTLKAVLSQILLPTINNSRALAMEIMLPNSAIANMIRDDKLHGIYSSMQTGQGVSGMQTMNQALFELVVTRQITPRVALTKSPDPDELDGMLQKQMSPTSKQGRAGNR